MIDKKTVRALVDEWLKDKEYFFVDLSIDPTNRIVVEIDHAEGVWIEDCVDLSHFIDSHLDREAEDFELEVGSAGIDQPFKVKEQYVCHIGKKVEALTKAGEKLKGTLLAVNDDDIVVEITKKVKPEGAKRPKLVQEPVSLKLDDLKWTKYLLEFK